MERDFEKLLNQENLRERRKIKTDKRETDVGDICEKKIRDVLRKMKKGKAQGSDDIASVEVWIDLGTKGVKFLVNLFNRVLRGEKIPN